ncbi:hypothetical protein KY289_006820 [Solanum tuberosum]|nr:hypothetical protein KY289_006820 [Solanum tuberosum]
MKRRNLELKEKKLVITLFSLQPAGFNSYGRLKVFYPSLIKCIGASGPSLHTRLVKEIRTAVKEAGGVTLSGIEKMPLVKSVVYETLRMDNPVPFQTVKARKNIIVSNHEASFLIKKDELIFRYQPLATKDSNVFKNVEEFNPDRFVGYEEKLLKYCIGQMPAGFNSYGRLKVFYPSLIKCIGASGPSLHTRLVKEIRTAVKEAGGVTLSGIEKMPLVKSVVYETLRMDNPVPFQIVKARKNIIVSNHEASFLIKKDELIFSYQPLATKDSNVFKNVEEFNPDRFVGYEEKLLKYCIGQMVRRLIIQLRSNFLNRFNSYGGLKVFYPSLIKCIGASGPSLHTRLVKEIRTAVKEAGRVTLSGIEKMPLVKSVVYETLRMDNPIPFQTVKARKNIIVSNHEASFLIKKDELIFRYQPLATKDSNVFKNVEEFNPDRFVGYEEKLLMYCIGQMLAGFNSYGRLKVFYPSLIKCIGASGPSLHTRLVKEIRTAVKEAGGLTLSGIEKMPLIKSVVYEILRMDTPVPFQTVKARKNITVSNHEASFLIKKDELTFGYQPLATKDSNVFKKGKPHKSH